MNHWLIEELIRLDCTDRTRELNTLRLQSQCKTSQVTWSLTTRVALKISDWLITTGERIQRRYENSVPVSHWAENRKFAR